MDKFIDILEKWKNKIHWNFEIPANHTLQARTNKLKKENLLCRTRKRKIKKKEKIGNLVRLIPGTEKKNGTWKL